MMFRLKKLVSTLAVLLFASLLRAQLIDVDFNNDSYGASHGGPNPGPTMSGAAVLGAAGDQWNGIDSVTGSGVALFYANGAASPVTMAFTSDGGYDVYAFDGSTPFTGTAYVDLMEDYLFNGGVPQTVTLSGLAASAAYEVILYNAADAPAAGRETFFTINGITQSSTWDGASGTFIAGVDYVDFPSAMSDASGNLVITYTGNGTAEGDIDGFQIEAVAPPTPVVAITEPVNGDIDLALAEFEITVSATVGFGTVTNVQFFVNGVSQGSVLSPPFLISATNLPVGTYALTAVATAAGISATSAVVNILLLSPSVQTNSTAAYLWTTLAGYASVGSADGVGTAAQFDNPAGMAVDSSSNIYVADSYNNIIREITPQRLVTTIAGVAGASGTNDGSGDIALFNSPSSVAVDGAGNVYVTDTGNDTIRRITPQGANWVVSTIAGNNTTLSTNYNTLSRRGQTGPPVIGYFGGTNDGVGTAAQFKDPQGIAVDSATNLYVTDTGNNTIRKISPQGTNWIVSTIAGSAGDTGSADGTNGAAEFSQPIGIGVDRADNLYVTDSQNDTIRQVTLSGTNWVVTTIAGTPEESGSTNGIGSDAQFWNPLGIAVDSATNLYVADENNQEIRKITPVPPSSTHGFLWVVSDFAGSGPGIFGSTDGTGTAAQFDNPWGVAADATGNLYVSDAADSLIRRVTSAAVVTTIAGAADNEGSADGNGSAAQFNQPYGVAAANGNLYVADTENHTIRQISSLGAVTTIAGSAGHSGSANGAGTAALFDAPFGVTVAGAGNLYVADTGNNTIRQITQNGTVTTIAGAAGTTGLKDGVGPAAQFNFPRGISIDGATNLYVADQGNHAIREITPTGGAWSVSTIAGSSGSRGTQDGIGGAAQFSLPQTVAVLNTSNLFVTDYYNTIPTIRQLTLAGTNWVVSTINVVGGNCVTVDSAGNLYVAYGAAINKLTPSGTNWAVSTIGGIFNSYGSADGFGSAARFFSPAAIAVDSHGVLYLADNNTIREGVFTAYGMANAAPYTAPPTNSSLTVTIAPANAPGQWRFPWELGWRAGGQTASNLTAGDYTVEFRNLPGWIAVPPSLTVTLANAQAAQVAGQYYPTVSTVGASLGGTLIVTLGADPPAGAGWRFLGDTTPFYPSGYSTNLLAGDYLLEFAPVNGLDTPPDVSVQVQPNLTTTLEENYTLASSAPAQVVLPNPVPFAEISDLADYPFGYNGQLQTDVGYGSGVAVQTNVVLTAAHLVFNDQTLSYVSQAYWYFQRDAGTFDPEPAAARGWYVLSGYAAQRTNDLMIYAPDTSTPQSRNLDAAALYFLSPVAGGGYGGYLPSDASPNPWLTGNSLKMLVGYPVDGSEFGDASIATNAGTMYATEPQPYPLTVASDPVPDQQVYTAPWVLSYPGNSGGPFYVEFNGYYYPAGIYLGTLFNGAVPYASAVRAIDSNVVSLITLAAALGDSGTNNSGGGIITIVPTGVSSTHPAYLIVTLGPPAAVAAGAAWDFVNQPSNDYLSASQSVQELSSSASVGLQFLTIPGWNLPPSQTLPLTSGVNTYSASYSVAVAWPTPAPIPFGTPLGSQQLNALAATTSGTYVYTPPAGTVLPVGAQTLSVTFTPGDSVNYGGPSTTNVTLVVFPFSSTPPTINTAQQSGGVFTFTWRATANETYQIQTTTDLTAAWVALGNVIATNSVMSTSEPVANSQQFYRVVLLP